MSELDNSQIHFIDIGKDDKINYEGFEIESDGTYVTIVRGNVHVQVKFDDDGVIVDMYSMNDEMDTSRGSCYASYDDFEE